jgi:hypothetical protein
MSAPDNISGPVGFTGPGGPFMSLGDIELLAAESRVWRGVADTEREECMAALRAKDESTGALLEELRGHFEHTGYWVCDTHDHQKRAGEIIDILAARHT